jgi:hypothetical protein
VESEAASIMDKVNLVKDQEDYKLPFRYRYLSENGIVKIIVVKQKEIIFTLRSGVGAGETLIYTPSDETIYKNNNYFTVTKWKDNWYYVEEH